MLMLLLPLYLPQFLPLSQLRYILEFHMEYNPSPHRLTYHHKWELNSTPLSRIIPNIHPLLLLQPPVSTRPILSLTNFNTSLHPLDSKPLSLRFRSLIPRPISLNNFRPWRDWR